MLTLTEIMTKYGLSEAKAKALVADLPGQRIKTGGRGRPPMCWDAEAVDLAYKELTAE